MQLFYNPDIDNSANQFVFPVEESKHIVKVLRKVEGDKLHVTNGKGFLYTVEILLANPKKCKVSIVDTEKEHPKMYWLHMAVAPTKMNDRYEWFLEKATEIGVNEITPIICDHSERKVIKKERMEKVIQAAMKQSQRSFLPKLNDAIPYSEFMSQEKKGLLFIAHCENEEKLELKRRVAADKDVTILIGPEGDFSSSEINTAYEKGFIPVSLGQYRLRTETAAIVACTTVVMINNG
ncbi:16S rRNA (uracil1498-N3)-methyltransferase [Saonia flava]|uniref:Ribosomal RNA small subunit methyltransferase E n=1 Tax=Saonia flava TaxID=523696 RepID=A0A846QQD5_9FLAO|nr:16S rRNA (uracil(1498)-N(3))-methyltransferase [Saonia flava]NJB70318.1 16S rRNA (uracil1498-N3)-methyltransferase [Saonia flava]